MDVAHVDVLVVGGGGAGLRAAIAAADTARDLRIGVISKVYPMRSHTVSAEGGAAAAIKPGDSPDEHAYDTMYTLYHPKWHRRPVSVWWWLERWCYARFVLRELTSLFIGFAAFVWLWLLRALAGGPETYAGFVAGMKTPLMLALHAVTLAAALFHAITWFHLTPRAAVIRIGGKRLPDGIVVGLNYCIWLAASFGVAWIWMRG